MRKWTWLLSCFLSSLLCAAEVQVSEAYIPQPPPGAPAVAYFQLENIGPETTLVDVESDRASMVMIHETVVTDGVGKMRHVNAVPMASGAKVAFAAGGMHIMFMRLNPPLKVEEQVPLTLIFADHSRVTVHIPVKAR